ncbi:MAG: hypothetical protein VX733_04200 [Candidatus Latescibacterota bacterium]|nr:hypothetical protein [Candidatus Latescibacterota bacterium]
MNAVRSIGGRRELFVDRYLVHELRDVIHRLHPPVRRNVVFQVEAPWENACTGCYNFLRRHDTDARILSYRPGHGGPRRNADRVRRLQR